MLSRTPILTPFPNRSWTFWGTGLLVIARSYRLQAGLHTTK